MLYIMYITLLLLLCVIKSFRYICDFIGEIKNRLFEIKTYLAYQKLRNTTETIEIP